MGRQKATEQVTKAHEQGRGGTAPSFTWHLALEESVMRWDSAERR